MIYLKLVLSKWNKVILIAIVFMTTLIYSITAQASVPKDLVVVLTSTVQRSPPQITINLSSSATGNYNVYRKAKDANVWGAPIATLPSTSTSYIDTNVNIGQAYEYKVNNGVANGFIYTGIDVPVVENRGTLILVVDNTYATQLYYELKRLEQDIVGDGWTVVRHDVNRKDSPESVKALIKADYDKDTSNVKSVFLFGHVPVYLSGDMAPDGHNARPWPADVFYGDMDGTWTGVNTYMPSNAELQVGRVDLWNLPAFLPLTELDLLRQYLDKDHNYRNGLLNVTKRALIDDGFGWFNGEAFSSSAWESFPQLCNGVSSIYELNWMAALVDNNYLWGYINGGGTYTSVHLNPTTNDFAKNNYKAVFTMCFGSYFGQWDYTDDLMRAMIATKDYGLTSVWSGRPYWHFQHMALGEPIGYSTKITQNNTGLYPTGSSAHFVHIALMGDPTLRQYPMQPPKNLDVQLNAQGIAKIKWEASPETVLGYYVYRAQNPNGPFTRISQQPLTETSFVDNDCGLQQYTYMVRAVRLETTPSGTFYNLSEGVMVQMAPNPLTLNATILPHTGEIEVTGMILDGQDERATIKVVYPSGNIAYLDQIISGQNGNYEIKHFLQMAESGVYTVYGGSDRMSSPLQTSFEIFPADMQVGSITFQNKTGEILTSIVPNVEMIASVDLTNQGSLPTNAALIVALYDSNKALKKLAYNILMIDGGANQTIQTSFEFPDNTNGFILKAFVWEDIGSLRSLHKETVLQ